MIKNLLTNVGDTSSFLIWEEPTCCEQLSLCVCALSCSVASDSLGPTGVQPARLLCPWNFPWQEYCSGLLFPSPGDLPDQGIEPVSPALAGGFFTSEPPGKPRQSVGEGQSFFLSLLGLIVSSLK